MPLDCITYEPPITPTRCVECPAIAPRDPSVEEHPLLGWNAGADSINVLDGNVHTQFDIPVHAMGVVVGFKRDHRGVHRPELIDHALWFTSVAGSSIVYVAERGVRVSAPRSYGVDHRFAIERRGGVVRYLALAPGAASWQLLHATESAITGPIGVSMCAYATGDAIS